MSTTCKQERLEDNLRKVMIHGKLDAPSTMAIEKELRTMLLEEPDQIIVDLSGVDYMSSYGLRLLLICAKALQDSKGGLHLAGANQRVMEIITMAGYDTLFPVYETVEDALLALTGKAPGLQHLK